METFSIVGILLLCVCGIMYLWTRHILRHYAIKRNDHDTRYNL